MRNSPEAIKNNGYAIEYVDQIFKKDKKIVLEAIKTDGTLISYADKSLTKIERLF